TRGEPPSATCGGRCWVGGLPPRSLVCGTVCCSRFCFTISKWRAYGPHPNPIRRFRKEGEAASLLPPPTKGMPGEGRLALGADLLELLERLFEGSRVYHDVAREGKIEFPDTEQHEQDQEAQHRRLQQMQLSALDSEERAEADGDEPAHDE